ncbi:MAG: hypothetical protein KIT43_05215 [Bauldia sp.]|nr:hypothetical protein [Bauldia sp.]
MAKTARPGHALLLTALLASTAATPAAAQLLSGILGGGGGGSGELSLGNILSPIGGAVDDILDPLVGGGENAGGEDSTTAVVTHEAAIAAVRENRAMSLADLMPLIQAVVPGQVIDVRLLEIRSALYYEVKVLAAGGIVYLAYFNALTGEFVPQR